MSMTVFETILKMLNWINNSVDSQYVLWDPFVLKNWLKLASKDGTAKRLCINKDCGRKTYKIVG